MSLFGDARMGAGGSALRRDRFWCTMYKIIVSYKNLPAFWFEVFICVPQFWGNGRGSGRKIDTVNSHFVLF